MVSDMGYMAKAWVAFVMAIVTALTAALSDDVFDVNDTTQVVATIIMSVATLVAVYKTRNTGTVTPPVTNRITD